MNEPARQEARLRQLASIVEHAADAITSKDADGIITEWNAAAARLYGYSAEEAIGRHISLIVPADRRGEETRLLRMALAGETVEQLHTTRRRRDGTEIAVSLTLSPLRDEHGVPCGAAVITRDISGRLRSQREREEALEALAEAQRIAGIGSWKWDVEADEATWTEEMYRIFGRDPAAGPATGEEFIAYVHPEDRERLAEDYARAFGGGPAFELDYRIQAGDGVERVLHAHGRQERPGHYAGTVQDVTSLREVERALAYSEEFFRSTLEHAPIGIALVSPEGRWLKVNQALCEIVGYEERELLVLTFQDITHPDDLHADLSYVRRLLAGEIPSYRMEKRYFHKSGREVWILLSVSLVRDERGEPLHFISQIQDITAEREAQRHEAELKQRLELILGNLHGSGITVYDRERRLTFSGGPLFAHLDLESLLGRRVDELTEGATLELMVPRIEAALSGETSTMVLEADPRGRTLAAYFAPYREVDGPVQGALVHWHDITPVRRAQRERDEALERFQIAFDRAPIGMVIVGLDGRFQRVNDALCAITGHPADELLAMPPYAIVHPEDLAGVQHGFGLLGRERDSVTIEHRIRHAAGRSTRVQARVTLIRDEDGAPVHALAQVLDITEQRAYEDRLRHMVDHDPLTGQLNRRGFEAALESHLARCRRYGPQGALLALDLDGFKTVNDALGHQAGDDLLVACGRALSSRLRDTDVVARVGGDEFSVLLPEETLDGAEVVAKALIEVVRERAGRIAGLPAGSVTASVGVAMFNDGRMAGEEMVAVADLAMYEAKQAGKDRYALCAPDGYLVRGRRDQPAAAGSVHGEDAPAGGFPPPAPGEA